MIWPFKDSGTQLDQALLVLNPFVESTLEEFDRDWCVNSLEDRLTVFYIFGAIQYLVSYDEMKQGSTIELLQSVLKRYFLFNNEEISNCFAFVGGRRVSGTEQLFMVEGASALRRMLIENDQESGRNLQSLLEKNSV